MAEVWTGIRFMVPVGVGLTVGRRFTVEVRLGFVVGVCVQVRQTWVVTAQARCRRPSRLWPPVLNGFATNG